MTSWTTTPLIRSIGLNDLNSSTRTLTPPALGPSTDRIMMPSRNFIHRKLHKSEKLSINYFQIWFLTSSPASQTAYVECRNGTQKLHVKPGISKHHLSPRCKVPFQQHLLFTDALVKIPHWHSSLWMEVGPLQHHWSFGIWSGANDLRAVSLWSPPSITVWFATTQNSKKRRLEDYGIMSCISLGIYVFLLWLLSSFALVYF